MVSGRRQRQLSQTLLSSIQWKNKRQYADNEVQDTLLKHKGEKNKTQTLPPNLKFLYSLWSNTGASHRERFPEEVFPQLNLVNNSTEFYASEQQPHLFWKNIVCCPQNYNDNQLLWLNPHRNKSADQLSKVHSEILILVKSLGDLPLTTGGARIYPLVSRMKAAI